MICKSGADVAALTLTLAAAGALVQTTADAADVEDANSVLAKDLIDQTVYAVDKSSKIGAN
jgi:hypothetical protein